MNERVVHLLLNSFTMALGTCVLALIIGLPMAFLLERVRFRGGRPARVLFLLPLAVPSYINGLAWISFLSRTGQFKDLFAGSTEVSMSSPAGYLAAIWVMGLSYYPFLSLLVMSGLSSINRNFEEQARLMGSPWPVVTKITIPLLMPFITAGILFVFILSLINYSVPSLFGINTYPLDIFIQFSSFYDHKKAILLSIPLLIFTMGLLGLFTFFLRGKFYINLDASFRKGTMTDIGRGQWFISIFVWTVIFTAGILPMLTHLWDMKSSAAVVKAVRTSWQPALTSLWISSLAAGLCVIAGFFLAYWLERGKMAGRQSLNFLTMIPLALPPTVVGIILITIWNRPFLQWIYGGAPILVMGLFVLFCPFAVRICASQIKQMSPQLEEAARLAGAGLFSRWRHITIPLIRPGLTAAWIICFLFCMGEVGMSLLVIPAGWETLSIKIYNLLHYGVGQLTSALCVVLIFLAIIPSGIVWLLWGRMKMDKEYYVNSESSL